jgi:hypothetical protein
MYLAAQSQQQMTSQVLAVELFLKVICGAFIISQFLFQTPFAHR